MAVECHDGVAGLQAGLVCRTALDYGIAGGAGCDASAGAGHAVGFDGIGFHGDAECHMLDGTVLDDFVGHTLDEVRRNGEADADGAGRAGVGGSRGACGGDGRVDADYFTGRVEGRAAGVAGIDGRVDLHGVGDDVVVVIIHHGDRAVQRGDDTGGGGVVVAQRVADRHHILAYGELVGISEFHGFEVARRVFELDDRKIGGGVGAHDLGGVHLAVA